MLDLTRPCKKRKEAMQPDFTPVFQDEVLSFNGQKDSSNRLSKQVSRKHFYIGIAEILVGIYEQVNQKRK